MRSGDTRSSDQATMASVGYRICVGTQSQVQPMKPSAIRIVRVTEFAPRPVRSVGYGVTGVLAPFTALRFEYVTAPRKLDPIVWKISANETIQTTTEPITAPRIPIVCPRVT